jgi:hypothetical protein
MSLWFHWLKAARLLRPACTRSRTFLWTLVVLMALSIRQDVAGVSSFIRGCGLRGACYANLLHLFHSQALPLEQMMAVWTRAALILFGPWMFRVRGRPVLVADGIKRPKEGRQMPAVKLLHQDSQSNSKAEYIMGHSCQAIALLVEGLGACLAMPLACRIHEGLVTSNRSKRSVLDRLIELLALLPLAEPVYLVADAYYASRKIILPLLLRGDHLITRFRSTASAHWPVKTDSRTGRRGRPKLYGKKFKLQTLFDQMELFVHAASPAYGEKDVILRYRTVQVMWRPVGRLVQVVAVDNPRRGRILLLCTDLELPPLEVIRLYSRRYKIEVGFKQAIHQVGAFAYHFWMRDMQPLRRGDGNQHLHRRSPDYRRKVMRKLAAYERHILLGLISQGLLQYLAVSRPAEVWRHFGSWMRTMKTAAAPSEAVVASALRHSLSDFLWNLPATHFLKKFLSDKLAPAMRADSRDLNRDNRL